MINPSSIPPASFTLSFTDGLWRLTLDRQGRPPRKLASWFTLPDAIDGARKITADLPNGATVTIVRVVNFKKRTEVLEFPRAEQNTVHKETKPNV
jgi:hypothetical protein